MRAFQDYSAGMRAEHQNDYARRVRAGELKNQKEKIDFVARFRAVLAGPQDLAGKTGLVARQASPASNTKKAPRHCCLRGFFLDTLVADA